MKNQIWLTVLAIAVGMCVATAWARDVHVTPLGTADGDGSVAKPFDLATAFSAKADIQPGDTILLKGGTYDGPIEKIDTGIPQRLYFNPLISGTAEKPIIITSAPGEWAHLNGALLLDKSSYLHVIRLEIGDLQWDPTMKVFGHAAGVIWTTAGTGNKVINCNLFGATQGTGVWRGAMNFELYGNLIHDHGIEHFGGKPGKRGEGHASYTQNIKGTKRLEHNISYRNYGWGIDLYTQNGEVSGFDVIENIGYLASYLKSGQVGFNFGLNGYKPAERIRFIGNVGYSSRGPEQSWRSNMRLMYAKNPKTIHNDAVVKNNTMMGTCRALVLSQWKKIEVTGNTLWGSIALTEIGSAPTGSGVAENPEKVDLSGYTVDDNTYIDNGQETPFIYGNHERTRPEEQFSFSDWQKLGLDKNSKMLPGKDGSPTGTSAFVFPNKYQKGRANVAIFAWDNQPSVEVDLSKALTVGQKYSVYNCLDINPRIANAKPILNGVFEGKPVMFPMKHDVSSPDFDAFLVLPE